MLKISRKGDYALLLLTCLAKKEPGEKVSLKRISRESRMPHKYLSQIAPLLVDAGILGSKEGIGGGYFLNREAKEISVGEVLEITEGPVTPVACMRESCLCEPHCLQQSVMKKMADTLSSALGNYTLADLIGK